MSRPYHVGNGVFGGGVPFIATRFSTMVAGVPLIGLLYPMAVAAIGVVVGAATVRGPTHNVRIWDEVGGLQTHHWYRTNHETKLILT